MTGKGTHSNKDIAINIMCPSAHGSNSRIQSLYNVGYIKVHVRSLLCEPTLLVKGKSFVTSYTDFSFKELKENALVKEFSLILKGICFID